MKIAHLAEAHNVGICPNFLMEVRVSLVCAVDSARWPEYIPQLDAIAPEGMTIEGGLARPSLERGIGIARDRDPIKGEGVLTPLHISI